MRVKRKKQRQVKEMKTKDEIQTQLDRMKRLAEEFEDDKLLGTIEALEWVLEPKENEADYMNDY